MELNHSIDSIAVKYMILAFLWIEFIWEFYIGLRQHKVCQGAEKVPKELENSMTQETFSKARLYTLAKSKFSLVKDLYAIILSTIVIYFGLLSTFWESSNDLDKWDSEIAQSCICLLLMNIVSTFLALPFSIYNTFVLEEEFGFNKQTAKFYVWDNIKQFVLTQALTLPLGAIAIVIIKYGGNLFFVWLWLAIGIISLVLLTVYPAYIAPLFDKYTPLPGGELRTQIEELASDLKFPLGQLYVVEGSKRSAHSNAYFYGLFGSKRIVLFDTLLAKPESGGCQNDEVLAVLSHELGHWSHGHVTKNLIIMQLNLLLMFAAFAYTFQYAPLYEALGLKPGTRPILLGLIGVLQYVMAPYNTLLSFLMTCLCRRFEFQADRFAVKLDRAEPLKRALVQLNKDNLGFPIYDSLYSAWHHSHPPLLERIAALQGDKKDN